MSPIGEILDAVGGSFPRVSGDEPALTLGDLEYYEFSPRERG